jgi:hypothetical protein
MLRHPRYTAPFLRLLFTKILTIPFFRELRLQHHFPEARLLPRRSFSIHDIRSLLTPACPERFVDKLSVRPGYHNNPKPSSLLFHSTQSTILFSITLSLSHTTVGAVIHGVASAPTFPAPLVSASSFLEVADSSTISGF